MPPSTSATRQYEHNAHLAYRPDIDGLRAVAILAVLVFHAFPSSLSGGFAGVDVFFVISGFLISSIIFRSLSQNNFRFWDFYAHRIKRIFPALITVLAASYLAGWFLLLPDEFRLLAKHIATGAGFLQNFEIWREAGYFDSASELKPLLHLWSLAVEEQFYIFYPLLIWGAWRLRINLMLTIVVVAAVSLSLNLIEIQKDSVETFFSPQTRIWELLAGACLACIELRKSGRPTSSMPLRHLISVLGLGLILCTVCILTKDDSFPGWRAIPPVLGACLLIYAGPHALINRHVLASRPMVFVGKISYPLYLWHWPLLSFARIEESAAPSMELRAGLVLLSFALAWLTYRFIEKPIRFGPNTWVRPVALGSTLMIMAMSGAITAKLDGLPGRFPEPIKELFEASRVPNWFSGVRADECHLQDPNIKQYKDFCIEAQRPLVMLWGDSHAASLYPGLHRLQADMPFGIVQMTQAGCGPVFDLPIMLHRKDCNILNAAVLANAKKIQPDVLLIHGAWLHEEWPLSREELKAKLTKTVTAFKDALPHTRIVLIGAMPRWERDLRKLMAVYWQKDAMHHFPGTHMSFGRAHAVDSYDAVVKEVASTLAIEFIEPDKTMCDAEGCLDRIGADSGAALAYIDSGHLSAAGATFFINSISNQILNKQH